MATNKSFEDKLREGRNYRQMEVRALEDQGEGRYIVVGYATTFNEPYTLYSEPGYRFDEVVDPAAFDDTDMSDVIMQFDHQGRVFARKSNDTLQLEVDDHGLKVTADLGGTEIGRQLYEEIKGGYVTKMSFGFTVAKDSMEREETPELVIITRRILKIRKLYDVSAVSLPANDATEITARQYGEGVVAEVKEEIQRQAEREAQREAIIARIRLMNEV